jgi:adenosylcobinamide kinase/adenosylcobinamide-phosphate guanylyltransferase
MTGPVPRAELLLGGLTRAPARPPAAPAAAWIARAGLQATLVATALAGDDEMAARIARHRADRAARVPGLRTIEEARDVAGAIGSLSAPEHLVVVDCLTLWLSQLALPPPSVPAAAPEEIEAAVGRLVAAVRRAPGPAVLVSNEIGLGVVPVSPEARRVVDALGRMHQDLASVCDRVTLLVAGCEMTVKDAAAGPAGRAAR